MFSNRTTMRTMLMSWQARHTRVLAVHRGRVRRQRGTLSDMRVCVQWHTRSTIDVRACSSYHEYVHLHGARSMLCARGSQ